MNPSDRPSLEERYSRAINSSHLEIDERRSGDVDVLIAAGWVPEYLGAALYRLRAEFDAARGDQAVSRRNVAEKLKTAQEFEKAAGVHQRAAKALTRREAYEKWLDASLRQLHAEAAAAGLREEMVNDALSERAFMLLKLKTLSAAKSQVGEWAMTRAARERFMPAGAFPMEHGPAQPQRIKAWRDAVNARNRTVAVLAGRVLDVYLDDNCARCQGRGFNGGYGTPQVLCAGRTGCGGSGRRRERLGTTEVEQQFAQALLNSLHVLVDRAARTMRGYLSQAESAYNPLTIAEPSQLSRLYG